MNKLFYLILFSVIFLSCKQTPKAETSQVVKKSLDVEKNTEAKVVEKKITPKKWIITEGVDSFKTNKLPFLFQEYYQNNVPETTYPYYKISEELLTFLKKNDYEGEEYECFLMPIISDLNILLINVLRGDSNYYLIITADSNEIKEMVEVGHIGDETDIKTFDISEDYIITKYNGFSDNKVFLKKIRILDNGKIITE